MWFDDQFDQMFRRLSGQFFAMDDVFEREWRKEPHFFGYSFTMGSDGRPTKHGNLAQSLTSSDVREPFVDEVIDKDGKHLKLVAEMPGVDKKDIKVVIEQGYANISAQHGDRKYEVKIPLKYKINENLARATYANGVLEVTLGLLEQKPRGKAIQVE